MLNLLPQRCIGDFAVLRCRAFPGDGPEEDAMKMLKQRPSLMLLLVTALLVLLPLLAVLQYRWLGEVSAGERERMQAFLKTSAERFCSDFDRELTNAYVQLQNP